MKIKNKLSLFLAVMMFASCFFATSAFAYKEVVVGGSPVYNQDFESTGALDSQAPQDTMFQYFTGMTKWAAVQPYSAIITKEATADDPDYIGDKYVLVGQTESTDLYSADGQANFSGRIGNAFTKSVSSGIINIDFDAKVSKNPSGKASGWSYFGLCDLENFTAEDRIIGLCNANGAIGAGLNGINGVSGSIIGLDTWGHISADYNLDTGELIISVNGGIPLVTKFEKTREKYLGYYIMSTHNSDFAIDNIEITENGVSRYVGYDNNFEEAEELKVSRLTQISTAETVVSIESELVSTEMLEYSDKTLYDGLNDVGYLAWSAGHNYVYASLVNGNGYKGGKMKFEFDALVGKGGLAFASGSNAQGGALTGRTFLVFQRNTNQLVYQNVTTGSYTEFYNSALYSNFSPYTVEGTDKPMTFVSNRWNHIEINFDAATGEAVLVVDGVRSNPITHLAFKDATSICYMYRVMGEAWANVYDKTAYIDNLKMTITPDTDITSVDTTTGKILITLKKDVADVSPLDISLSDGLVEEVEVSGNKILAVASGMEEGWRYNLTLSDNVIYADGTELNTKSYIFDYTEDEFTLLPTAIVSSNLNAGETISCVADINCNMTVEEFTIYAAAYDENGKLAFVTGENECISKFEYGDKSINLLISVPSDYQGTIKKIKTFVWKENIIPYESDEAMVN